MRYSLTLSPQIVALAHVRRLKSIVVNVRHVCESRIALMNLVSGSSLERPISGIWKRSDDDFKRYGRGGLAFMLYAATLLIECQYRKSRNRTRNAPGVDHV